MRERTCLIQLHLRHKKIEEGSHSSKGIRKEGFYSIFLSCSFPPSLVSPQAISLLSLERHPWLTMIPCSMYILKGTWCHVFRHIHKRLESLLLLLLLDFFVVSSLPLSSLMRMLLFFASLSYHLLLHFCPSNAPCCTSTTDGKEDDAYKTVNLFQARNLFSNGWYTFQVLVRSKDSRRNTHLMFY